MICAYCEAGIAEIHTHEAHVCIECGDEVQAVDDRNRCVSCISMAHMAVLINKIEGAE